MDTVLRSLVFLVLASWTTDQTRVVSSFAWLGPRSFSHAHHPRSSSRILRRLWCSTTTTRSVASTAGHHNDTLLAHATQQEQEPQATNTFTTSTTTTTTSSSSSSQWMNGGDSASRDHHHRPIRDMIHQRPEHLGMRRQMLPALELLECVRRQGPAVDGTKTHVDTNTSSIEEPQGTATLGDIMNHGLVTHHTLKTAASPLTSTTGPSHSPLSSSSSSSSLRSSPQPQSLAQHYGFDNPLDRMVLTANGNLQRLISSYYDSTVSVHVHHCTPRRQAPAHVASPTHPPTPSSSMHSPVVTWDRVVHLQVWDQTFCTATSVITVRDPLCVTLVESGQVGLGQLFRYLDLLPEFELVHAGHYYDTEPDNTNKNNNHNTRTGAGNNNNNNHKAPPPTPHGGGGGFWREYRLECPELSCRIREDFVPGLWTLQKPSKS